MPRALQRTESLIFEVEKQLPSSDLHTSVPLKRTESVHFELAYLSSTTKNSSASTNGNPDSASTWVSLPALPPVAPLPLNTLSKSRYVQYSSPLGPSPRKLYRRVYPYSSPKLNLYRRVLIACAKEAAERMPVLTSAY